MKLENRIAVVAGGGQGIGEGCVRCFAEEGADVAVLDVNRDNAEKMAAEVEQMGRKALPIVADLTVEEEVDRSVQEVIDALGRIDILVNNVGGVSMEMSMMQREQIAANEGKDLPSYMQFNADVWDKYYQLNLKSHVMLCHAVTPQMIEQRSGRIINISSIAARMGGPDQMPYNAFKAGDISLTWSVARALAPHNVTVNCICPGHVYTPLWERGAIANLEALRKTERAASLPEDITPYEYWLKYRIAPMTPLGRDQTIEDMGRTAVFFASDDARNITGQVLHVDGGMIMR